MNQIILQIIVSLAICIIWKIFIMIRKRSKSENQKIVETQYKKVAEKMKIYEYNLPLDTHIEGKKLYKSEGSLIRIIQRPGEQIVMGSLITSRDKAGYLETIQGDDWIEVSYVGISCTVKIWIVTGSQGNIMVN